MFTCIACTKQMADGGEEVEGGARGSGTPSTKEAVKSLTAQVLLICFFNILLTPSFFSKKKQYNSNISMHYPSNAGIVFACGPVHVC